MNYSNSNLVLCFEGFGHFLTLIKVSRYSLYEPQLHSVHIELYRHTSI